MYMFAWSFPLARAFGVCAWLYHCVGVQQRPVSCCRKCMMQKKRFAVERIVAFGQVFFMRFGSAIPVPYHARCAHVWPIFGSAIPDVSFFELQSFSALAPTLHQCGPEVHVVGRAAKGSLVLCPA